MVVIFLVILTKPDSQKCGIEVQGSRTRLHGHRDEITCLQICQAFSIVVSGSQDRTAIIWDLNRLAWCYVCVCSYPCLVLHFFPFFILLSYVVSNFSFVRLFCLLVLLFASSNFCICLLADLATYNSWSTAMLCLL